MKKTMKIIGVILSAAILAAMLAACGAKTAASTSTDAAKSTAAAISGTVSTNGSTSMEKVIGSLKEQFMSSNPGVTVSYDATGSGTGRRAKRAAAGDWLTAC